MNDRTFANAPPELDVDASHATRFDGAREYEDHARVVLALLGLEAIFRRRAAGQLSERIEALDALSGWESSM